MWDKRFTTESTEGTEESRNRIREYQVQLRDLLRDLRVLRGEI